MSNYTKRLAKAATTSARAQAVFSNLENEFLAASREQREVHDELQVEIDRLVELQEQALNQGLHNEQRAQRVRELFL